MSLDVALLSLNDSPASDRDGGGAAAKPRCRARVALVATLLAVAAALAGVLAWLLLRSRAHSPPSDYTRLLASANGTFTAQPSSSPGLPEGMFLSGAAVRLTALPQAGFGLEGWLDMPLAQAGDATIVSHALVLDYTVPAAPGERWLTPLFEPCYRLALYTKPANNSGGTLTTAPSSAGCARASSYLAGESVAVTAAAASGFVLTSWAGSDSAAAAPADATASWTLSMPAADCTLVATFEPCHVLTLARGGSGVGSLSPLPKSDAGCAAGTFATGDKVPLQATAAAGNIFIAWTGDSGAACPAHDCSDQASFAFTMPAAAAALTAQFAPCSRLTLGTGGSGKGSVTSPPASTKGCPWGTFAAGESVALEAAADTGSTFTAWTGDSGAACPAHDCSDQASFAFTMPAAAATLTAHLERCYALSAGVADVTPGSIGTLTPARSYACDAACFVSGAAVSVTAVPDADAIFLQWSGDLGGANASSATLSGFTMPAADAEIDAFFAQCYALTLSTSPADGSGGAVSFAPSSTAGCAVHRYISGAQVRITAAAASGFGLSGWAGSDADAAAPGDGNAIWLLTMPDADTTLNATFAPCLALTLTASPAGASPIRAIPDSSAGCAALHFAAGAQVSIYTAYTLTGFGLVGWAGSDASAHAPVGAVSAWMLTMPPTATRVVADFAPCHALSVSVWPTAAASPGQLYMWINPECTDGCDVYSFVAGAKVWIQAGVTGYALTSWAGSDSVAHAPADATSNWQLSMPDADTHLNATFVRQCYALSLSLNPAALPPSLLTVTPQSSVGCALRHYHYNEAVTVSASPTPGFVFWEWEDNAGFPIWSAGRMPNYTFVISYDTAIRARYDQCYALALRTVPADGSGGTLSSSPSVNGCAAHHYAGAEQVQITAVPASGWGLAGWAGSSPDAQPPWGALLHWTTWVPAGVNGTGTWVTANFAPCYALTLHTLPADGSGGTLAAAPSSHACAPMHYIAGESVAITAAPGSTFLLTGWAGSDPAAAAPAGAVASWPLSMPAAATQLTATFAAEAAGCLALAVYAFAPPDGSVSVYPAQSAGCVAGSYFAGESILLTATPSDGHVFSRWYSDDGSVSGSSTRLWITMRASLHSVTADFAWPLPPASAAEHGERHA
jgi:hypothetical protein